MVWFRTGMPRRTGHTAAGIWIVIVVALSVTIVVAWALFRVVPAALLPDTAETESPTTSVVATGPGVQAVITVGDVRLQRSLPSLALALGPREVLDPRLPPGRFEADFVVRFNPGSIRRASLGAEIQGASLTIERRGKVLLTASAGEQARTMMSEPVFLPGREMTFTYKLRPDGTGPVRLRALWRPQNTTSDLPLPSSGGGLFSGPAEKGYVVVQKLNCVACHHSDNEALQAELAVSPAPILGQVGSRVRPHWLGQWLADPHAVKHGAAMPALFNGVADAEQQIQQLIQFLVSLGGPINDDGQSPEQALSDTGSLFYHRVGCVACHGPLEAPAVPGPWTPLGPVAAKTTIDQLAAFLRDPVALRPAGRMPSLRLSDMEAEAIAAFLVDRDLDASGTPPTLSFTLDAEQVHRGREVFATRGCSNCHELGPDRTPITARLTAPPLESLASAEVAGCVAVEPVPGVPYFSLDSGQRHEIAAFLNAVGTWRSVEAPLLALAADLDRLNCVACHDFHGVGGVAPSIDKYFVADQEVDAGDEGRLPPPLGGVGAKLNPAWLNTVLANAGVARPYMATRMPQFGAANVGHMAPLFAAAAGVESRTSAYDEGPVVDDLTAEVGRRLTGDSGFNCIQCHSIAGRASTNLPGPDLVGMPERLRWGFFSQWLHDPRQLRPGTRMPTFFYAGRSGLQEFGGDADRQIEAMWGYLSQGEFLPLPDGLHDPGDYQIEVLDEPIVLRTFMTGAGERAIACGFPEQIHFAFDATRCRVAEVWVGRFLSAAGAWAARGGSQTDPEQEPVWIDPGSGVIALAEPSPSAAPGQRTRFRGYLLDTERRPTFHYEVGSGDALVQVREQPIPVRTDGRPALHRRFELTGSPGQRFVVQASGHRFLDTGDPADEPTFRRLDENGTARFVLELTW